MDHDRQFDSEKAQLLARLAALQRLKDEMARNNRFAMTHSIDQMIAAEAALLAKLHEEERRNSRDASNDGDTEQQA